MKRIVILISGRGSNMLALLDAQLPATVAAVISNVAQAKGLAAAQARGIPTLVVDSPAGKIPLTPNNIISRGQGLTKLRDPEGKVFVYPDPVIES